MDESDEDMERRIRQNLRVNIEELRMHAPTLLWDEQPTGQAEPTAEELALLEKHTPSIVKGIKREKGES
jgi:hypothetical protein